MTEGFCIDPTPEERASAAHLPDAPELELEPIDVEALPEPSPAMKIRLTRCLGKVQRMQSDFWDALQMLEQALGEYCGETIELKDTLDFSHYNADDLEDIKTLIEDSNE